MKSIYCIDGVNVNNSVSAGLTFVFPHVWGWTKDNDVCQPSDIRITLTERTTIKRVIEMLEEASLIYVKSLGCSEIRHYFIEDLLVDEDECIFSLGT